VSNLLVKELKRSKYRLLGLVGQGQFGRVYCASHRKTGRLFALKELDKERFPTHKFLRELRFLLSLQHSNIVTCHALEHTRTGRYLVLDYCEGGTLRSLMDEDVRLHPALCLKLVTDILSGLNHAHAKGIIHCDIKPENILLTLQPEGWTARISDFGIARLSQEIITDGMGNTGSPAYMAPERFYGQYSQSSDLYAVGVLLFELLAGYRPFSGVPSELMSAHMNSPVKIPDIIPAVLQTVILAALQKLPGRRFQSASEMMEAVQSSIKALRGEFETTWTDSKLIQPAFSLTATPFKFLREEFLQAEVYQLISSKNQDSNGFSGGRVQPVYGVGVSLFASSSGSQNEQVYQVLKSWVGCQNYPDGILEENPSRERELVTVRLPETLQKLVICPQGCFTIAQRSIYRLPFELFKPGIAQHGQKRLQQGSEGGIPTQHMVPQLIAEFSSDFVAAIDPQGHWLTTVALSSSSATRSLRIWYLSKMQPVASVPSPFIHLFELLALDSRHIAAFSHTVDPQSNVCITGTVVEIFTRRGTLVGCLNLPVPLRQITKGVGSHTIVAMEPGHPDSMLLIDLKPLRISRIGLEISPVLAAATSWGYVLISAHGEVLLLDKYGQAIGRMEGPPNPTAISVIDPHGLLIATWKNQSGSLYTIDLRQLELDVLF